MMRQLHIAVSTIRIVPARLPDILIQSPRTFKMQHRRSFCGGQRFIATLLQA